MVKITDLNFYYGKKHILKNVSVNINKGSLCGLLGPNGSGKSTLFKCCLNFLKYNQGLIEINGKNTAQMSPSLLAKTISYVPQEHKPPFPFTIKELVLMGRTPHMGGIFGITKEDDDIATEAMETVGITNIADIACTRLSGGQRQLALIARALAQEAPVMLLDEPTSALDFSNQIKIWQILKKITSKGVTIIACSHDPNHILWFADQTVAISNGIIEEYGKTDEILNVALLKKIYKNEYLIGDVHGKKIIYPLGI